MFIFAHVGIGKKLASPWAKGLPLIPLLVGTLLPDIVDKGMFYGLRILDSTEAFHPFAQSAFTVIDGTRTFGHTAIFLLLVLGISGILRSRVLAAVALGMATHLLLDNVSDSLSDVFRAGPHLHPNSAAIALLWPILGTHFTSYPFDSAVEHLKSALRPDILITEILGILLLAWDYWKSSHRGELLKVLFSRRYRKLRRYRMERD
jgi:hypothetical protein